MRWLVIVLVAVILVGVWIVGIFFPEYRAVPVWVTASVVALALGWLVVRWVRKRLKARAMERAMMNESAEEHPEIAALQADMQRAVRALKAQRRGAGGGATALYGLPWFVIIGPPAVGKTTAFERSGLSVIPSAAGAPKIQGTAGTRNCDWWFTREAILLDTAGRFTTGPSDHDEWMAFLDTLHRLRPERPLDGLMVAVSLPDLLAKGDAEREDLASKLRERIDEVQQKLEMVLPVYLLLTKADLVAGFVEFWSDLGKPQRAQVWGASFAADDPRLDDPRTAVEAEFDILVQGLYARLLERLPVEREATRRTRLLQFPLELRAFRTPLSQFVAALCQPAPDGEPARLRGFYITSAMQVGRPVERVLSEMVRGFDLQDRAAAGSLPQGEMNSYFLGDLFKKVMLADVGLAMRSSEGTERRTRREFRLALVALGVAAFILFPATVSYLRNTQLANDVDRTMRGLKAQGAESEPGVSGDPIEPMLETLDRLDSEASGFSIPGWFGPRAAIELRGRVRRAYVGRIHAELRNRVAPYLEKDLANLARASHLEDPTNVPDDPTLPTPLRRAYDTLKLAVTLADPADHVQLPWAAQRLARLWQRALPAAAAVDSKRLELHATNYLTALSSDPGSWKWPVPPGLEAARSHMKDSKDFHVEQLPYHWVLRQAYDPQGSIFGKDIADEDSRRYLRCLPDQELISPQFTASGWKKVEEKVDSKDAWPQGELIEPWVMTGDGRIPKGEKEIRDAARRQYFDEFVEQWMAVFTKCGVIRPTDFRTAKAELTALKGPNGFYKALFAQLGANAIADSKTNLAAVVLSSGGCNPRFWEKVDSGSEAKVLSPVQQAFSPLIVFAGDDPQKPAPLDKYLAKLDQLRTALVTADASGTDPRADFAQACHEVEGLLDGVQEPARSKLRALLLPPVAGTIKVGHSNAMGDISGEWQKTVWDAWDSKLRAAYPFAGRSGSNRVASFDDFRSFFQPDGTLWGFVKGKLADWVERGDSAYFPKHGATPVSADVLSCLSVAQEITDAFFPAGDEPGLRFSLELDWSAPDLTEAKFYIADKATPLTRAQWSAPLKWNGERVRLEWLQGGRHTDQIGRSFSLFDLFDQLGRLKPTGVAGMYRTEYPPLEIKVRAESKRESFQPNFFARLHCPQALGLDSSPAPASGGGAVRDSDTAECPR